MFIWEGHESWAPLGLLAQDKATHELTPCQLSMQIYEGNCTSAYLCCNPMTTPGHDTNQ